MHGIFTYIWVIFTAHVGKYSIHGAYGIVEFCVSVLMCCVTGCRLLQQVGSRDSRGDSRVIAWASHHGIPF